ncbi:MAG: polyprenyl synthetase family protein [Kofleriaceae bacterium]
MTSSEPTLAPSTAPPELLGFFDEVRQLVDRDLARRLAAPASDPGRLIEAMRYAATGPGKRMRPAVVIAAAEACGGTRQAALPAASAIEMLHAYTLVHDDLPAMDDDDERRGRATVHVAFGEAIAILAGDGLLTTAFSTLTELGPYTAPAVEVLGRRAGARELLGGQAIDLTTPPDQLRTLEAIERLHAAKTGSLFAAAAELGAIAAGAPPATSAKLGRYGMALGVAFQHADDRDDGEFGALAAAAADRIHTLGEEAIAIADSLGPRAIVLQRIARWFVSRASVD